MIDDRRRPIDRVLNASVAGRLLLLAVVLLVPAGLVFQFVVRPRWAAVTEVKAQIAAAKEELDNAQQRVALYGDIRRQSVMRQRFLDRFDSWVPVEDRFPEVLASAALAARTAGVWDLTFLRNPAEPGAQNVPADKPPPGIVATPLRLDGRGSLKGVAVFVDTLLASPRYLRLDEMRVRPLSIEKLARIPSSDEARLDLTVRLTTFHQSAGGS